MTAIKPWNEEQEDELLTLYVTDELSVDEVAELLNRNKRSIISKLVRMKVYRKPENDGTAKRSVKGMIRELEELLGIYIEGTNLSKKSNLIMLVDALNTKLDQPVELE